MYNQYFCAGAYTCTFVYTEESVHFQYLCLLKTLDDAMQHILLTVCWCPHIYIYYMCIILYTIKSYNTLPPSIYVDVYHYCCLQLLVVHVHMYVVRTRIPAYLIVRAIHD